MATGGSRTSQLSPSFFICAGGCSAVPTHSTTWFWGCTTPAPRGEASGIHNKVLDSLLGCFVIKSVSFLLRKWHSCTKMHRGLPAITGLQFIYLQHRCTQPAMVEPLSCPDIGVTPVPTPTPPYYLLVIFLRMTIEIVLPILGGWKKPPEPGLEHLTFTATADRAEPLRDSVLLTQDKTRRTEPGFEPSKAQRSVLDLWAPSLVSLWSPLYPVLVPGPP